MSHVIPTLRTATATRLTYTPPAARRTSDTPVGTGTPASSTDFRTVLNNQSTSAVTTTATASVSAAAVTASAFNAVTKVPAATTSTMAATTSTTPANTSVMAPTAQSLFGDNPWCTDAGGTGPGVSYSYNPYCFASAATAAKVAQMLGGKVVAVDAITPYGPFTQNQPNLMVQMPDGKLINAGLIAGLYDHGYSQQTVDQMIAAEVSG